MRFATLLAGACAAIACAAVQAQPLPANWPTKPVRIVVPFAPGGTSDTLARSLAQRLGEVYKQTFVIENRPGAAGTVGLTLVAKSPPDGYTLGIGSLASHVIAPVVQKNVQYEATKEWTHIAFLGGPPTLLFVAPTHPARDFKSFMEWAKKQPGGIPYATPGSGTHAHLLTEVFERQAGIPMTHVPYRGSALAMGDLIAGHIQVATLALAGAAGNIRAGKMRPLAVTSERRLPELPEVPTFGELGFKNMTALTWFTLSGPAGMPADIVASLNIEARRTLAAPENRERLKADGIEPNDLDSAAVTAFVRSEAARWQPVARAANITPD
jgi:tripartite-type tricarboxylate transporter receptor subunit TctC